MYLIVPCLHKFADYLYLNRLDFTPVTLIAGTFNPGWNNLGNYAGWLYGRTQNNYFWDVLPRLYGEPSLKQAAPPAWKAFCKEHGIALTDLVYSIEDADITNPEHSEYLKNYRDDLLLRHFKQIDWVNIPQILEEHSTIRQVFLTRRPTGKWREQWRKVEDYCQNRKLDCHALLTPSGSARFQMPKPSSLSLGDFILSQWRLSWNLSETKPE